MTGGSSFTDEELAALGVSRIESEYGTVYIVPCAVCGRETKTRIFSTAKTYKCKLCRKDAVNKRNAKAKAVKRQHEMLIAEAIGMDYEHLHRFEKGSAKFGASYSENIETARKAIEKYDSIPEVVACIELLHIGVRVIVHQKVGDFTVDFCLPDEKMVIEIDGSIYHTNEAKEQMRDYAIMHMLGDGWEVRHIPSDTVMKNHAAFGKGMRRMLNARKL